MRKQNKKRCRVKPKAKIGPNTGYKLHLVITRETGDMETYKLAEGVKPRQVTTLRKRMQKVAA